MERPARFEHVRYIGDKRCQLVYDVDDLDQSDADAIDELMDAGTYLCFAPDTLAEARNRGYRLYTGRHSARRRASGA
jgi:hypothetical protein